MENQDLTEKFLNAPLFKKPSREELPENSYQRTLFFTVPPEHDKSTVEEFLRREWRVTSRLLSRLKQVENGITVDGEHIRTIDFVRAGQVVALKMPEDILAIPPEEVLLEILYEDNDLLAVNKPAGIAVHPTFGYEGATLAGGVIGYFLNKNQIISARTLNRLDRYTSGVVLFAKHPFSADCLLVGSKKEYTAIVHGELYGSGVIAMPIRRKPSGGIKREVHKDGKYSRTRWVSEAVDFENRLTKLGIVLDTGRTHQIRVHFKWLGNPLAGDFMYGIKSQSFDDNSGEYLPDNSGIDRQALHCRRLSFTHPITREPMEITAPYPADMQRLIDRMDSFLVKK